MPWDERTLEKLLEMRRKKGASAEDQILEMGRWAVNEMAKKPVAAPPKRAVKRRPPPPKPPPSEIDILSSLLSKAQVSDTFGIPREGDINPGDMPKAVRDAMAQVYSGKYIGGWNPNDLSPEELAMAQRLIQAGQREKEARQRAQGTGAYAPLPTWVKPQSSR